jgi:hypothetical protein
MLLVGVHNLSPEFKVLSNRLDPNLIKLHDETRRSELNLPSFTKFDAELRRNVDSNGTQFREGDEHRAISEPKVGFETRFGLPGRAIRNGLSSWFAWFLPHGFYGASEASDSFSCTYIPEFTKFRNSERWSALVQMFSNKGKFS